MTYFKQSAKISSRQKFWPYGMRHTKAQFTRGVAHLKLCTRSMVHWFMSYSVYSIFQMPPVCLCGPWSLALMTTMVLPALMLQKPTQIMRSRSMHVTYMYRLGLWLRHMCTKTVASHYTLHGHHTQTSHGLRAYCQEPRTGHGDSCLPPHSI